MRLLVFMYHRAVAGRHGNAAEMLDLHFGHLARNAHCVLPGDELDPKRTNVCITFDDAYYDFFALAYPLLEKHRLKALLAVCPGLLAETTAAAHEDRIGLSTYDAFAYQEKGGLCTWEEVIGLANSGRIAVACHGRTHVRLDNGRADLHREIVTPGNLLRERLGVPVENFVFPFGRFDQASLNLVNENYRYAWRIGHAGNRDWSHRLMYRITGDGMASPSSLLSKLEQVSYRLNYHWNSLRGR